METNYIFKIRELKLSENQSELKTEPLEMKAQREDRTDSGFFSESLTPKLPAEATTDELTSTGEALKVRENQQTIRRKFEDIPVFESESETEENPSSEKVELSSSSSEDDLERKRTQARNFARFEAIAKRRGFKQLKKRATIGSCLNSDHEMRRNGPELRQFAHRKRTWSCPTSRPPKAVINRICSEMQLLTSEAYEDLERQKRISKQKRNKLPTIPENAVPMIRTFARAARRISTSLSNIFFPKKSQQKTLKNTESEL